MQIIDRYLLRQFLQTFFICFLSLTGLYIVFDSFTNLDHFFRCGQKSGSTIGFMASYYAYHSIQFFDMTASLLAMVSAMFTVSWIQRNNELTALMAAGVSRVRVVVPIIAAVTVISLLSAANRELLIPRYRAEISRRPQDPLGDLPQGIKSFHDSQIDVVLDGKNTYANDRRIEEPVFRIQSPALRDLCNGSQLSADNAYYEPAQSDRPAGYRLVNVHEPKNLDTRQSLFLKGKPVLITPHDAPDWLKKNECFVCSDVEFDLLTPEGAKAFKGLSSTMQLISALQNPSLGYEGDVRVAIHGRIVQPLLDITLLFLCLPLVVARDNRNVFLAVGTCMAMTIAFTALVMFLQQMGGNLLIDPALSAWIPLMIFVPAAVGLSDLLWT